MIPVLVLPYVWEHLDVLVHAVIGAVAVAVVRLVLVTIRGPGPPPPE